jgi:hypothetical protein
MKIGASYNLFDGEELLESSILSIRDSVDFISVVYQTQSNLGNPCNPQLTDLLLKLRKKKIIDEVVHYNPDLSKSAPDNEIIKRNIGLILSTEKKCTHHLSIDADELYEKDQFEYAKKAIIQEDYDSSACRLITYYKNDHTILDPMEDYYVPFLYKIRKGFFFESIRFPLLVDPTRRMPAGKLIEFNPNELIMHHYSYVRKDMRMKLENSSAKTNFTEEMIENIITHYETWQPGIDALIAPERYFQTKTIKPKFRLWQS